MDPAFLPLYPLPRLSAEVSGWSYFWLKFPYAMPSFLTFLIGLFLITFSSSSGLSSMTRRRDVWTVALTFLSYSALACLTALRSVVADTEQLLWLHRWIYPVVLLLAPLSFYLIHLALGQPGRLLLYFGHVCWIPVVAAFVSLLEGVAFTGRWYHYSFGSFPEANWPIKVWGVFPGIGLALVGLPAFLWDWQLRRSPPALLIGLFLLFSLTLLNLPVLAGFPIYPGSNLHFVPMLLIIIGLHQKSGRTWLDLLFAERGLFYFLNAILAAALIILSLSFFGGLRVLEIQARQWFPAVPITLIGMVVVFASGIFIGGLEATNRINQYLTFILAILGFYLLLKTVEALYLDPIIEYRVRQLLFIPLAFLPALLYRLVDTVHPGESRWAGRLLTVCGAALAFFPFSDLMFSGYYNHAYGRIPAPGALFWAFPLLFLLFTAITAMKTGFSVKDSLAVRLILFCHGVSLLILLDLFRSSGLYLFPYAWLLPVPGILLLPAIHARSAVTGIAHALRITVRLSLSSIAVVLIFLSIIFLAVLNEGSLENRLFYLILGGSPLLLLTFLLSFLFAGPIAEQLDLLYRNLIEEREKSDRLLDNILPPAVAFDLKRGVRVEPRLYDDVTVLFADFAAFSSYATTIEPSDLVRRLDSTFQAFDELCHRYGVEKLKTIGDAYMCVAGLTSTPEQEDHAVRACRLAQAMMELQSKSMERLPLPLRIGIHSGPVVGGVTGSLKLSFDIWGHTVNVAARLEASSLPGRIHISEVTYGKLGAEFPCEERGLLRLKNIPEVRTYFLDLTARPFKSRQSPSYLEE
ncbi:MAG: hypothetical protein HS115_18430 [Spirochaetales bacterium]|nr:hypothetical protein [Spirochaetales bacterium]